MLTVGAVREPPYGEVNHLNRNAPCTFSEVA